ncbi:MAG: SIR2 family protein [Candidatus Dadabacteria bacterium]|nr:SIR2 family protein [Candidatus Dadabacteria bacterium]
MKRVVYIIGAGFSQPLGLPTISNFFEKAKELNRQDPTRYKGYKILDKTVKDFSIIKNYCKVNLFNIEELLSITEMRDHIGSKDSRKKIIDVIVEVIQGTTPPIKLNFLFDLPRCDKKGFDWDNVDCFEQVNINHTQYCSFVSHIHGIAIHCIKKEKYPETWDMIWEKPELSSEIRFDTSSGIHYDIISLNYDTVLEDICDFINTNNYIKRKNKKIKFKRSKNDKVDENSPYLIKLHGSIDDKKTIVPPTWKKGEHNNEIKEQWEIASELISNANHIVFLGYSLPANDNYILSLLQSSIKDTTITSMRSVNSDRETIETYKDIFPDVEVEHTDCQSYLQKFQQSQILKPPISTSSNCCFVYNGGLGWDRKKEIIF